VSKYLRSVVLNYLALFVEKSISSKKWLFSNKNMETWKIRPYFF